MDVGDRHRGWERAALGQRDLVLAVPPLRRNPRQVERGIQLGVIFAGRLNGLKARMKLMVALACTREQDALEAIFAETN